MTHATRPSEESQAPRAILTKPIVSMIERYPQLIRESYGDKVKGHRLEGHAWSMLRMLRRVSLRNLLDSLK